MLLAYIISGLVIMGFMLLRFSAPARRADYLNALAIVQSAVFFILSIASLIYIPQPSFFFSRYLMIDQLAVYGALVSCGIFLLASIYARGYVRRLVESHDIEVRELRLFYAAYNLLLLVVVFAFYCNNLALFWILLELTTIILFALTRQATGTGTLNWDALMQQAASLSPRLFTFAFVFVFIGFAAKAGIVPFHTWLPQVHAKAPSVISVLLSAVLLNIGIFGVLRLYAVAHLTAAWHNVSLILIGFGVLTIAVAALSMLPRGNVKKLVAFDKNLIILFCRYPAPAIPQQPV